MHLRPAAAAPRWDRAPLRPRPASAVPRCGRTKLHLRHTTTAPRCSHAQLHIRPATAAPRWGRAQLHLRPAAAAPRWGRAPLRPRPASVAPERGPELSSASMSWVKGGCPAGTAIRADIRRWSVGGRGERCSSPAGCPPLATVYPHMVPHRAYFVPRVSRKVPGPNLRKTKTRSEDPAIFGAISCSEEFYGDFSS